MRRSSRIWIGLVAIVCIVVHATMIVRHAGSMLAAQLAHQDLVASLGMICHGAGAERSATPESLPEIPEPDRSADCPMCAGAAVTTALLPDRQIVRRSAHVTSIRQQVVAERVVGRLVAVCPPSTGPPLFA